MGLGSMMAGGNPDEDRGRRERDHYPTPREVTEALLGQYPWLPTTPVWEPCCGDGAMSKVLEAAGCKVVSTDIAPLGCGDVMDFFAAPRITEGAIITNPPFNIAEEFIRHAWRYHQPDWMALVLKSTFWHAKGRQKLWDECRPRAIHPLTWRPDFLQIGRPTMEVMWCVWNRSPYVHNITAYYPINK